jgi:hypothetical protein
MRPMASVVQRIKEIKQPRGGYINPKMLETLFLGGSGLIPLDHASENVSPGLVGLAVDYLARLANGAEPQDAFSISLMGATALGPTEFYRAERALESLTPGRVDEETIRLACRLVNYDVIYRAGQQFYNPNTSTTPDQTTIDHIFAMVTRSLVFFDEYGPIVLDGFTFEGGYTATVHAGDGDFLTADTLWDFKVSAAPPKSDHTLQVLMYYLMGKHSIHHKLQATTHLGIFNPRLNTAYRIAEAVIPAETIAEVERDVIGYTG